MHQALRHPFQLLQKIYEKPVWKHWQLPLASTTFKVSYISLSYIQQKTSLYHNFHLILTVLNAATNSTKHILL